MRFTGYIILLLVVVFSTNFTASSQDSILVAPPTTRIQDTANSTVTIANTRVTGYKKTKLYIIQREIPFKDGETILKSELQNKLVLCRQQLMNTSLFVDVEVTIALQQNNLVFIDVKVKERWYLFPLPYFKLIDRNLNQWWVEQRSTALTG